MYIKIFVSHRIDLEAEKIENSLFNHIQCGSFYDLSQKNLLRDDIGSNISEKRMKYCEFTVQYWAWKNVKADYYGFCHYRRYLSFSEKHYEENIFGCIEHDYLDDKAIEMYKINEEKMKNEIENFDLIFNYPIDVSRTSNAKTVYDYCAQLPNSYNMNDVDRLIEIVIKLYPQYEDDVNTFFSSSQNYWYNCYILKKDLFNEYCEWLFNILLEFEKTIPFDNYNQEKTRIVGVMGERLFGVFVFHLRRTRNDLKIKNLQLVYFKKPQLFSFPICIDTPNCYNIIFSITNYNIPILSAAIFSMLKHKIKSDKYNIHILQVDVSEHTLLKFKTQFDEVSNMNISIYDITKFRNSYPKKISIGDYFKLISLKLFETFNKVLYLDADIIVKQNLAEIFDVDVKKCIAAACYDYDFTCKYLDKDLNKYFKEKLESISPLTYFQTGVILYNMENVKLMNIHNKILERIEKEEFNTYFSDVFNLICHDNISILPYRWNYCADGNMGRLNSINTFSPLKVKESYAVSRKKVAIIHFHHGVKPWQVSSIDFAESYWLAIRESVFYEEHLKQLMEYKIVEKRGTKRLFKKIINYIFPKNTIRRQNLKKIYYKIRKWPLD